MTGFTFANPWFLLLLLLLPLIAWLRGKRGEPASFIYSSVQLVRPIAGLTKSHAGRILGTLRWFSLVAFIIALAQPRLIEGDAKIRASGVDIVVAIDLSTSMAAEDFELEGKRVNRLEIAKDVLRKFIQNRPNDRIGLVAFAGRAYVASPLTLDHDFLLQNLERLYLGMIEDQTAIGSGLSTSLNRLRDIESKSKIVILMTDGVNNAGKVPPLTAAEVAETLRIKVYTIGIGTRGEAPVPYTDMFGQRRYQNVPVDVDEPTLQKIAEKTGGKYYRADNTESFRKIYAEIDRMEKTEFEVKKYQQFRELFQWVLWAGAAALLLEVILANTVWRKLP